MSAAPQKPFDPSDEIDLPTIGELVEALRELVAASEAYDTFPGADFLDRLNRWKAAMKRASGLLIRIDQISQEAFPNAR